MPGLTGGVIDATAQRAFRYGACAGLAIALHDVTGWPLVKVADADSVYRDGQNLLGASAVDRADAPGNNVGMGAGGLHWLVLHPSGRLLDIDGLHTGAEILSHYDAEADDGQAAIGLTDRDDAIDEYVDAKGEPVPLKLCGTFTAPLLDTLN